MVNPIVPSMYLYLVEGTVICITNSILLFCILGNSKNRTRREFLLIAAQCIADTIYALAFMFMAEHRLNLVANAKENSTMTVWQCALNPALPLHDIATPLLGLLPLTTSVNFLLCTLVPLWYMRAGPSYTTILLIVPHALTYFLVGVNYILIWGSTAQMSALCVAAKGAAEPHIYGIMLILRMAANLASAIIYAGILIYLYYNQKRCLQDLSPQQKKTHRNATITLGFVTLNSFTLLFVPDVLLFFNPWDIVKTQSTPLYSMTLSKTMINFFIYMWRYRELAEMVMSATCRRVSYLNRYLPSRESSRRGILSTVPRGTASVVGDTTTGAGSTRRSTLFRDVTIPSSRRRSTIAPMPPRILDVAEKSNDMSVRMMPGRLPPIRQVESRESPKEEIVPPVIENKPDEENS